MSNGSERLLAMATKGVDMSTGVVAADWIKRIADDERKRDAVRVREEETAARKADLRQEAAPGRPVRVY